MKGFVLGVIAGAAAAVAFNMTDSGCRFLCRAKKKFAKFCRCAEKELNKMQDEAHETAQHLACALKDE